MSRDVVVSMLEMTECINVLSSVISGLVGTI